jgi:HAD superfamily hydrolase (TIGR01484 family)
MRYLALASDYDNTIATDGRAPTAVIAGLQKLKESGRKLILVTGRELPDLLQVLPEVDLFDRVVAENGALLYRPQDRSEVLLSEPWPEKFLEALRARGVPLSAGRSIIATVQPHETTVLECIREFGLELQVIFNREAVMILPSGTNKASGLLVALQELQLSPHNLVAIGDGENDHAFIDACECAVAVSNAVPSLCERADFVTAAPAGSGVLQVIEALLRDDFAAASARLRRHYLTLGTTREGTTLQLPAYGHNVLIAGTSGGGKSTLASGFFEQLGRRGYQYCIIDPEGDYDHFEGAVSLGSPKQAPSISEIMQLLEDPLKNLAVNMLGIKLEDRPPFFQELLSECAEMRARVGRPHWLLIDEAHHLLPDTWAPAAEVLPEQMLGLFMITVHPNRLARVLLQSVSALIAIGKEPSATLQAFGTAAQLTVPAPMVSGDLPAGEAVAWLRGARDELVHFTYEPPRGERKRHQRKYAEGDLGAERSFYFRGADARLNLRAQNLRLFMQIGDGVDDATWLYHLRRGDYSRWFAEFIKDEELARAVRRFESDPHLSARDTRAHVRAEIEQRYTESA